MIEVLSLWLITMTEEAERRANLVNRTARALHTPLDRLSA
jgi:hypothetical protein